MDHRPGRHRGRRHHDPQGLAGLAHAGRGQSRPRRFHDPDRFDPDRRDNEHLGFCTGIHYCFGAPLARIELRAAVPELFRRVKFTGVLEDPPPYRANAVLRGPRHLPVTIEGLAA